MWVRFAILDHRGIAIRCPVEICNVHRDDFYVWQEFGEYANHFVREHPLLLLRSSFHHMAEHMDEMLIAVDVGKVSVRIQSNLDSANTAISKESCRLCRRVDGLQQIGWFNQIQD